MRKIGLAGAVFLLVGNIIGASIFVLPGQLAGVAGPAVFVAYLIACIPAISNSLIAAQVGGILPVSAVFIYIAVRDNTFLALIYISLVASGGVYYFIRELYLRRHGVSLDGLLRLETEEAARATRG